MAVVADARHTADADTPASHDVMVDATLQHHAADDMVVVETVPIDGPVAPFRVGHEPVADGLDAAAERRDVAFHRRFRLGHGHAR